MASPSSTSRCCSSSDGLRSATISSTFRAAPSHISFSSLVIRQPDCVSLLYNTIRHFPSSSSSSGRIAIRRQRAPLEQSRRDCTFSKSSFVGRAERRPHHECLCGEPSAEASISGLEFRRSWRSSRGRIPRAVSSDVLGDVEPPESSSSGGLSDEGVSGSSVLSEVSLSKKVSLFQDAFWRFLRPHTIRGTVLGSTALVAKALIENPQLIDWVLLPKALRGVLALLCGNGYIVGINQIYDVGIDKINKPFLPIAAGDLSIPAAWGLVLGLAALGIGIAGTNFGPLILALYSLGLVLGTIYSVPPLHLKRFAVPAFLIIATVRGFLLNFGVYYATRAALGLPFQWSPSIIFITCFVTVFATVIAITKDLPDVEGDRKFNIATFAMRLGVRNISFMGAGLLLTNYIAAIVAAVCLPQYFNRNVMIPAHSILAGALVYQTWLLDSAKYTKKSIAGFYRFIWNLFYSQYILLPFI